MRKMGKYRKKLFYNYVTKRKFGKLIVRKFNYHNMRINTWEYGKAEQ